MDVRFGGRLGHSDHLMVEFRILHGRSKAVIRITTPDIRRANFVFLKVLLGEVPWVRSSEES